ncbi:Protein involved in ribosomal biogenesis [Methanocella conradii HZ254]|uniref:Protein involved in ribosomal biogenesis n=1 Tax=Methanocella conradii (strain DSM 24694 / JCM 17849 / CGMCC 1.5162 / HZ254) TaxID=1041930 RepID=H8I784_METCZ|nr:NIP7 N-terminal domain-related protein [Methanocella conradii]AFD00335.1 Protein involved in ribosomal biogenesis [Methanocella conradii HZ254]MDI6895856.1 ribosomal biogenesis protein [Methanocella conradii]
MYRGLKKLELTIMRRSLDYWGAFDLSKEFDFIVRQGERNDLFAVTPEARHYVIGREPEPVLAGLHMGTLGKKSLALSMEGAFLVAQASDKKKVKVTGQAESLVVYGRDVFGSSITWADESIRQNDPVIIANKYGEAIGIGRARFDYAGLFQDRVTVSTEADIGLYIRG